MKKSFDETAWLQADFYGTSADIQKSFIVDNLESTFGLKVCEFKDKCSLFLPKGTLVEMTFTSNTISIDIVKPRSYNDIVKLLKCLKSCNDDNSTDLYADSDMISGTEYQVKYYYTNV